MRIIVDAFSTVYISSWVFYFRFHERGSEVCLSFGHIHPSQPAAISNVFSPLVYRLPLSKKSPAEFLDITAYSRLG